MARIVDFHHHATPPDYVEELRKHGIEQTTGFKIPKFDPIKNLKTMDKLGIDKAYLSISVPGVYVKDDQTSAKIARIANEGLKGYKDAYPDRYGALASVPFPAQDESVEELRYALDTLGLDGVCVMSHVQGHYFGEPGHDALFAELNERSALVFIHPDDIVFYEGQHQNITLFFERSLSTTRSVYNLVLNGYMEKYPNIRYIASHGGGGVPVMARRIARQWHGTEEEALGYLRRCYFDLAQRGDQILEGVRSFAGAGQIVFGSDLPYNLPPEISVGTKEFLAFEGLTSDEKTHSLSGVAVFGGAQ